MLLTRAPDGDFGFMSLTFKGLSGDVVEGRDLLLGVVICAILSKR